MRSNSTRNATKAKAKVLPQIGQLDIRYHPVMVLCKSDDPKAQFIERAFRKEQDGFALFLTAFDQLSGGQMKQIGEGRPLYAHVDRKSVEARAKFYMGRKMVKAFRLKNITIQMEAQ